MNAHDGPSGGLRGVVPAGQRAVEGGAGQPAGWRRWWAWTRRPRACGGRCGPGRGSGRGGARCDGRGRGRLRGRRRHAVGENPLNTGRGEHIVLLIETLVLGADPRVAEDAHTLLSHKSARSLPPRHKFGHVLSRQSAKSSASVATGPRLASASSAARACSRATCERVLRRSRPAASPSCCWIMPCLPRSVPSTASNPPKRCWVRQSPYLFALSAPLLFTSSSAAGGAGARIE